MRNLKHLTPILVFFLFLTKIVQCSNNLFYFRFRVKVNICIE